jgi:Tol biopolymer transport system component
MVYHSGLQPERQFLWVDRAGREIARVGQPAPWGNFDLSPDETRVVTTRNGAGLGGDVWMIDLARGVETMLTSGFDRDSSPVWAPDGEQIAFTRDMQSRRSQAVILRRFPLNVILNWQGLVESTK